MSLIFLTVFGVFCLFFRVWLVEIKLHDHLGNKRLHTSQFINLYFFIAMILGFEKNVFTLISIASAPAMLLSFITFDILFYISYKKNVKDIKDNLFWANVERLTLHIPVAIYGFYFYLNSSGIFYLEIFTFRYFILSLILIIIPMFLFDPRITKKEDWPRGPAIIAGSILAIVGNLLFYNYFANKVGYYDMINQKTFLGLFLRG